MLLASGGRIAGNRVDKGGATGIIVNGTRAKASEATVDGSPVMTNRNASFSSPVTAQLRLENFTALNHVQFDEPNVRLPTRLSVVGQFRVYCCFQNAACRKHTADVRDGKPSTWTSCEPKSLRNHWLDTLADKEL